MAAFLADIGRDGDGASGHSLSWVLCIATESVGGVAWPSSLTPWFEGAESWSPASAW